jgi:protein involved in polysaccharide export with SLBB domain
MFRLRLFLAILFVFISSIIFAQLPSLPANLSAYRSADVSNEQLAQIVTYVRQNNVSLEQAYNLLLSRGMAASEAQVLRSRIERGLQEMPANSGNNNTSNAGNDTRNNSRYSDTTNNTRVVDNPNKIFGLEIFNNNVFKFEPNLKIATPVGYVIGPDDEITISIYGYQEAKYNLTVSPEGDINIPYVGVIYVAGLTMEQATAKIKSKLATAGYANIRTGLTKVNVAVGRIRSIQVTVLGEVRKPGTYTLPSLATAFNALYLSGGPNEIGSMRRIEIIRNGKVISHLDIYDFLVKGDQSGNINLRDQDVIRIPPYDVRVSLTGQVKRSGLFEMLPGETFQTLLNFAGGFSDSAYTASVTGYKATDIEKRIIDIDKSEFSTYKPSRAESFVVKKLVERFTNRVTVLGSVYLPGDYELTPGMNLRDLLVKAQGLTENAYRQRGLIRRQQADLTPELISFNPYDVMQNNRGNIALQRNDSVIISTVSDLRDINTVTINGEVRHGGSFPFVENMSLKDLVLMAGGFTDAAIPQRIEVARRIRKDTFSVADVQIAEVFDVKSIDDLETRGNEIKLQPYDAVIVRRNPGFIEQVNVKVEGEVVFPGPYVLQNKNERVSDLIKRAGGLTLQAYEEGGFITRINKSSVASEVNTQKVSKMQEQFKDTTHSVEREIRRTADQIAVDLGSILAHPGGKEDIVLEEGDVLTIQKEKMEVRISGDVLFPTSVIYQNKFGLKDYISRAGGFTDNSRKARVYVLYPNGNAGRTRHFLFVKSYPKVTPGSEIIVPKRADTERRRLTTGEVIGITTALTSFAGVLLSVLLNSK